MKTIRINKLTLVNFKGVRSAEVDFGDSMMTTISGRNGTGKSTIRDAFLWLLFDKNAAGEKDFGIKTKDADGNVIPNIPHEVSGELSVNSKTVKLRKCLTEKWVKKSGEIEKVFSGNVTEYYINDVPKKKSEYDAFIADICDEMTFRAITSPTYLVSLPKDKLRAFLFDMVGELSDYDIAGIDADLNKLLDMLSGKSLDDLRRQIAAEKLAIKKEMADIPARIDELERTKPEERDWKALESELAAKRAAIASVDDRIASWREANKARHEAISSKEKERDDLVAKRMDVKRRIYAEAMGRYDDERKKHEEAMKNVVLLQSHIEQEDDKLCNLNLDCEGYEASIYNTNESLNKLREEWHEIQARKFVFDESEGVCPVCGNTLKSEDIEAKRADMEAKFNERKAQELDDNAREGKLLSQRKKQVEADMESCKKDIEAIKKEIEKFNAEYQRIKSSPEYTMKLPDVPNVDKIAEQDAEYRSLSEQIEAVTKEVDEMFNADTTSVDMDALRAERLKCESEASSISGILKDKDTIARIDARISELNARQRVLSQELAGKEQVECWMDRFSKRKVEMTEANINSKFAIVKWRMYNQLINGGEEPTCVATINGADYKDANSAAKINAGIDIINAVSAHYGVYAPVFLDNAESVNELLPCQSQVVRLVVTTEYKLTVTRE